MAESTPPDHIAITIKITPEQKRLIDQFAKKQGVSPETAVRTAIEREVEASTNEDQPTEAESSSFLEATRDLAGSVDAPQAPPDLSSNREHMEGYGQ